MQPAQQQGIELAGEQVGGKAAGYAGEAGSHAQQGVATGGMVDDPAQRHEHHESRVGGVGAWIDVMLQHKQYDAIVIFSDFEDGIMQYRSKGETIPRLVFDADLIPRSDDRTDEEKAWEERWVKAFGLATERKAPRLYLYSTSKEPQELYRRCVAASGGEYKMVTLPRGGMFPSPKK